MPALGPYKGVSVHNIDKLVDILISGDYKNQKDAVLKAGYTEKVANHRAREMMTRAAQRLAERKAQSLGQETEENKQNKIAVARDEVIERWKYIALEQDKDMSTSFRALQGMGKYVNVDLSTEEKEETKAPVINIGIINKDGNKDTIRVEAKESHQKLENAPESETDEQDD